MTRKRTRQKGQKGDKRKRSSPGSFGKTTTEFKLQMREFLLEEKNSDCRSQIRRSLRFFDRHYALLSKASLDLFDKLGVNLENNTEVTGEVGPDTYKAFQKAFLLGNSIALEMDKAITFIDDMLREVVGMDELYKETFDDNLMIKGPLDFYRETAEAKMKKIRNAIFKNESEPSFESDSNKKVKRPETQIIAKDSAKSSKLNFDMEQNEAEYTPDMINRDLLLGINDVNFDEIYQNFRF